MKFNDQPALLYQHKLTVYSTILTELNKLIAKLENELANTREFIEEEEDKLALLTEHSFKVDDICETFYEFLIANSLFMPAHIFKPLSEFCHKVLDSDTLDSESIESEQIIKKIDRYIDELIIDADKISELLRQDLQIEHLNVPLFKRLF